MRTFLLAAFVFAFATPAFAACVGTANFYTCNDSSGNSYTVSSDAR
jgi:hypothetical protein